MSLDIVIPTNIYGYLKAVAYFQEGRSLAGFLLEQGRVWGPLKDCPLRWRGAPRQCYRNSTLWAIADDEVTYCEGYAISGSVGLPLTHAWVVDRSGAVIDPTWKQGVEYFGLAFRTSFLKRWLLSSKTYGVLDNMKIVERLVLEPAALKRALATRAMKRGRAMP